MKPNQPKPQPDTEQPEANAGTVQPTAGQKKWKEAVEAARAIKQLIQKTNGIVLK